MAAAAPADAFQRYIAAQTDETFAGLERVYAQERAGEFIVAEVVDAFSLGGTLAKAAAVGDVRVAVLMARSVGVDRDSLDHEANATHFFMNLALESEATFIRDVLQQLDRGIIDAHLPYILRGLAHRVRAQTIFTTYMTAYSPTTNRDAYFARLIRVKDRVLNSYVMGNLLLDEQVTYARLAADLARQEADPAMVVAVAEHSMFFRAANTHHLYYVKSRLFFDGEIEAIVP